jgi:hypothetical protein
MDDKGVDVPCTLELFRARELRPYWSRPADTAPGDPPEPPTAVSRRSNTPEKEQTVNLSSC